MNLTHLSLFSFINGASASTAVIVTDPPQIIMPVRPGMGRMIP